MDIMSLMSQKDIPVNQPLGQLNSYEVDDSRIIISFAGGQSVVDVIRADILNFFVRYESDEHRSQAVCANLHDDCDFTVEELPDGDGRTVAISTDLLRVIVRDNFAVEIDKADGTTLCRSYQGERTPRAIVTPTGAAKMARTYLGNMQEASGDTSDDGTDLLAAEGHDSPFAKRLMRPAYETVLAMEGDEHFYGLGDKTGFLDKKYYAWDNWNTDDPHAHNEQMPALYKSIPFLITRRDTGCFGLFFDNPYRSRLDLGRESSEYYYYTAFGGNLDIYFFYAKKMADVITSYTALTGRTPLPQLWTLGYSQSRWGYDSADIFREVAKRMREEKIPCDSLYFDIDYMDGYRVFTWNEPDYGAPKELLSELKSEHYHPMCIIDPGVKKDPGYFMYDEGEKNGYFAKAADGSTYVNAVWPGDAVFPDFGRSEVRKWWASKEKILTDWGFEGTWNDMNEPASFRGELPDDVQFTDEDLPMPHARMHNIFGHLMSRATYKGLADANGRRPFVITRACYAGTQRYATVWTGDNMSLWSHLQMMIPQLCNLGMSGYAICGTDIGGFGGDVTPELLTRWIEAAVFSPLFRNHCSAGSIFQEPWMFGRKTLDTYRKAVELHYQMLPLIYDLLREGEQTGLPVMRPLVLAWQNDPHCFELNDEYMVGDQLLAAPVVTQGAEERLVYLPEGTWYDYDSGEKYEGGRSYIVKAPLDHLPMFAREGAVIPNWDVMQYVGEKPYDRLYLKIFPGEGHYMHYRDNGEDFAYRSGEFDAYAISHVDDQVHCEAVHRGYDHLYREVICEYQGRESKISLQ